MAVYRYGSGLWSDGNGYKKAITFMKMLSKQIVIIENERVKMILEEQSQKYSHHILEMYEQTKDNYNSVMGSHAYRLGRFLLKPIYWMKKRINRNKR